MKLLSGLIILSIIFVDSSQHTNDTIVRIDDGTNSSSKNINHKELTEKVENGTDIIQRTNYTIMKKKLDREIDINTAGERRWMTIFPKNTQKFLVTMKSIETRNSSNPIIKRTRKTPVYKIIPKVVNTTNENFWKRVTTRPPLMKFTKFTINPTTTLKITTNSTNIQRQAARKYKSYVFNKMMGASKKDDSSEEINIDAKENNEKARKLNTVTSKFQKIRSKVNNEMKKFQHVSKLKEANSKLHSSEFSSEEREDKEEFIFVKPKKIKENPVKVIRDSSESNEITTFVYEHETKKRHKRSTNVIEEENLGTTVSGFKFTGKVKSLSSDLFFRNINT